MRTDWLTVKEYAARYRLHVQTVYTAIRTGRLPHPVERATLGPRSAIRIAVPKQVRLQRRQRSAEGARS